MKKWQGENKAIDKPKQLLEEIIYKLDANRKYIADKNYTPDIVWAIYKDGTIHLTPSFLNQELGIEEKLIRKEWMKRGITLTHMNKSKEVDYKKIKSRHTTFNAVIINPKLFKSIPFFEVEYDSIDYKSIKINE